MSGQPTEFTTDFKKGDRLCVISGREKGKIGNLKRFFPKKNQVLIEGVNLRLKHLKPNSNRNEPGGRIKKESPLPISNVALVCPKCADPTWIRHEILPPAEEGGKARKYRICKLCKARIDE
ncbi:MAG: 50S ribosomal protein L24 [Deltaproteobacteria bacterium]|jgi:large subunit ribosomal protein L24|nr:50S ribosomal protein L24 [Deltaproteobacteria bacterium]